MTQWVRNAVMLTVIAVWAAVVITSLVRGIVPDAITWGVPGAAWMAMNPPLPRRRGDAPSGEPR